MTDRMRGGGERDAQKSGPGRPSATKVRPGGDKGDEPQPLTKAERRARAKERKARAARARKRRQAMVGVGAGLAVVVVIVGATLLINHYAGKKSTTASASASASGSAAPSVAPSPSVSFPPVPAGADPALSTKPTVDPPSGTVTSLQKKFIITGTGPKVASEQTVTVNYVGVAFSDGKEFDSSWSRSQAFTTPIGSGQVIPGWDQGLVDVPVGSRVQLDIPSNLAYGDSPTGGQPAGALRFVVDVLSAS